MGVAIAAFRSASVIEGCLDSLLESKGPELRVVVTDNASPDNTRDIIRAWAARNSEHVSFEEADIGELGHASSWLTLLRSPVNGGFAYATNRSLELLMADKSIELFWVLNPDCRVAPDAASAYRNEASEAPFALMGGRTLFAEHRDTVQTDGGRVSRWTGTCHSVNRGKAALDTPFPNSETLDFITGANCVASRRFLDQTGLMEEGYFLYYEEVDWAFRRGALPLKVVPDASVWHLGGTAIGSGSIDRRPSAFSNYFNYRNRIRFMARFRPIMLPAAYAFAIAKACQLMLLGAGNEALALLSGLFGKEPPSEVRDMLSSEAGAIAFGKADEMRNDHQNRLPKNDRF